MRRSTPNPWGAPGNAQAQGLYVLLRMPLRRWRKTPASKVADTTGWPTVRVTYEAITKKLNQPGTAAQKKAAIAYWKARLDEDLALISQNLSPATTPTSPPAPY